MNITATGRIQFAAGHRVRNHEGKCQHLHGHNYVALFEAGKQEGAGLDKLGRVIDFGALRRLLGKWIDDNWDHGFIVGMEDTEALAAMSQMRHGQKVYVLPVNPTAENLALHLLLDICPALFLSSGVTVTSVTLWETENCMARACV